MQRVQVLPGEERTVHSALLLLAMLVSIGGLVYQYVPTLARAIAVRVRLEQERALGTELEVLLSYGNCQDKAAETALSELSAQLTDYSGLMVIDPSTAYSGTRSTLQK